METTLPQSRAIQFGINVIKGAMVAFLFTAIWANTIWFIATSLNLGFDPASYHNYQGEIESSLFWAIFGFITLWGSVFLLRVVNTVVGSDPVRSAESLLKPISNNPTLVGWMAGSAVYIFLMCTTLQSMFETKI